MLTVFKELRFQFRYFRAPCSYCTTVLSCTEISYMYIFFNFREARGEHSPISGADFDGDFDREHLSVESENSYSANIF